MFFSPWRKLNGRNDHNNNSNVCCDTPPAPDPRRRSSWLDDRLGLTLAEGIYGHSLSPRLIVCVCVYGFVCLIVSGSRPRTLPDSTPPVSSDPTTTATTRKKGSFVRRSLRASVPKGNFTVPSLPHARGHGRGAAPWWIGGADDEDVYEDGGGGGGYPQHQHEGDRLAPATPRRRGPLGASWVEQPAHLPA